MDSSDINVKGASVIMGKLIVGGAKQGIIVALD